MQQSLRVAARPVSRRIARLARQSGVRSTIRDLGRTLRSLRVLQLRALGGALGSGSGGRGFGSFGNRGFGGFGGRGFGGLVDSVDAASVSAAVGAVGAGLGLGLELGLGIRIWLGLSAGVGAGALIGIPTGTTRSGVGVATILTMTMATHYYDYGAGIEGAPYDDSDLSEIRMRAAEFRVRLAAQRPLRRMRVR